MGREPHAAADARGVWPEIFRFGDYYRHAWVRRQAALVPAGARVLDVGAGPCRYRGDFGHCRYETQDFVRYEGSEQGAFSDRDDWSYGSIDYLSDAADIPILDATFDAVLCTEVLEHVPDPVRVVREFARIIKPGGRLILTAPLGSGLHQEPFHFYGGYTPYWYRYHLADAGFNDIHVEANGGFFRHYGQESQRFSAMLDPRRCKAGWPLLPFVWLLTLPWFRFVLPVACHFLDRLDRHRGFTVGYHVTAVRASNT